MSWEANVWAIKQRMKLPQEQLVLIVLGNCADPDAVAFSKWPGRDHWWKYLSKITRLSRSSLFRHINTIVALGLASRSNIVLSDGSRRPTIALNLEASFDIEHEEERYLDATQSRHREESHGDTGTDESAEEVETANDPNVLQVENDDSETESHHDTSPTSGTEDATLSPTSGTLSVPPAGLHIESKSFSKESPPTPSGGFAHDDDWDRFVRAWGDPISKFALARSAWGHIATDKRGEVVTAARGYFAWLRAHPKPPSPVSAQSFLRDSAGWAQWLRYAPAADGTVPSISSAWPMASPEAKAIAVVYETAGLGQFLRDVMIRNGAVSYRKPVSRRLLALADAGPKDGWIVLTRQQAAAWEEMLRETVTVAMRHRLKEGDRAPWPWPPSAEGKIYSTGPPPETLMTEQDEQDLVGFK